MFKWLKSLFTKKDKREADFFDIPLQKPKRPRLYKQATVVTSGELPIISSLPMATPPRIASLRSPLASEASTPFGITPPVLRGIPLLESILPIYLSYLLQKKPQNRGVFIVLPFFRFYYCWLEQDCHGFA